jgi:transposase
MKQVLKDDGWRLPDEAWNRIEQQLPSRKAHPLGCHNPRIPDRTAMDGILFVLRMGIRWNALDYTDICTCSSAYRRFREWQKAGVFAVFTDSGLSTHEALRRIDWSRLKTDAVG